uniref:Uncharacterized protein n=1 Tax=Oryza meridionalis TaxID=40149 RepID=A0A0E0C0B6_9ORYZ
MVSAFAQSSRGSATTTVARSARERERERPVERRVSMATIAVGRAEKRDDDGRPATEFPASGSVAATLPITGSAAAAFPTIGSAAAEPPAAAITEPTVADVTRTHHCRSRPSRLPSPSLSPPPPPRPSSSPLPPPSPEPSTITVAEPATISRGRAREQGGERAMVFARSRRSLVPPGTSSSASFGRIGWSRI